MTSVRQQPRKCAWNWLRHWKILQLSQVVNRLEAGVLSTTMIEFIIVYYYERFHYSLVADSS